MNSVSAIIEEAFPSRIAAVEALRRPHASSDELRQCSAGVGVLAERFGRVPGARDWNALRLALETVAFLAEWSVAVEGAEPDADRHLRAARLRLKKLAAENEPSDYHVAVAECLAPIASDMESDEVAALRMRLSAIPMSVSILADPKPEPRRGFEEEPAAKRDDLAVAFLEFTINGNPVDLLIDARQSLLDVLRETLNLTGTKKGCNQGACGACTVLLDGRRVNACLTLAVMNDGAKITTIEGLARDGELHPLQAAFIAHEGLQCGYCTAGQIMSGIGCIEEGHARSAEEVRAWMSGNICRCGAYPGVVAAIVEVAGRY